jgi:hypothetical protein
MPECPSRMFPRFSEADCTAVGATAAADHRGRRSASCYPRVHWPARRARQQIIDDVRTTGRSPADARLIGRCRARRWRSRSSTAGAGDNAPRHGTGPAVKTGSPRLSPRGARARRRWHPGLGPGILAAGPALGPTLLSLRALCGPGFKIQLELVRARSIDDFRRRRPGHPQEQRRFAGRQDRRMRPRPARTTRPRGRRRMWRWVI